MSKRSRNPVQWPKFMFAAGGKQQIFNSAAEVPASGWYDTPAEAEAGQKPSGAKPATTTRVEPGTGEIDAAGWPWSADLHAASKSKTSAGLWRMKVGVARPAPKALDL